MSIRLESAVSVILVLCAVAITGSIVRLTFSKPPTIAPRGSFSPPKFVPGWEEALRVGIHVGDTAAPVKIVEFTDLECPACRRFHGVLREALSENVGDVSFVFVHLPLSGHRFAFPAARAAECAYVRGRFLEFVDAVFEHQDSLGIKPWGEYALNAGIQDTAGIGTCAWNPAPVDRIQRGLALARALQVFATPTVLVNGWHIVAPTKENLTRAIEAVRQGRSPADMEARDEG